MKIFETLRENFKVLGIDTNQSKSNIKLVMTWLILSLATTLSATFLFVDAKTSLEYTTNVYTTSDLAVLTLFLTIVIFKMEKLFKFIHLCEDFINRSELDLKILFEY